ncbi:MAG: guanylate kinase [Candidatus Taylorbacteria bacterium]|nr:guanylate kinase [Candidatus Taylorbacteria bacterium]
MASRTGTFIIIIGPSGSGKTELVRALLQRVPNSARMITATTRQPRPHERHGREYFFLERSEFEKGIARGDFFEHAEVYGNLYGLSRHILDGFLEKNDFVFLIIDEQGARRLKTDMPESFAIFIRPDSIADLEKRLITARPETPKEELRKRIDTARHELSMADEFDAVVENFDGRFGETVENTLKILARFQKK